MTDTVAPEPTSEQAALFARVRRMMLIAGLTSALAVAVVLIAIGYRLYRSEGSPAALTDITATLPKGARIVSTGIAGDRLVVTLDTAGMTEIRTFDAKTLKPAGRLKFVREPCYYAALRSFNNEAARASSAMESSCCCMAVINPSSQNARAAFPVRARPRLGAPSTAAS